MAEDPLHDIIESVSARLKADVETQLRTVSERHQQALEEQRARIETEAEQLWAPQLQAARTEVEQQAVAAAQAKAALADLQQLMERERSLAESRLVEERRIASEQLEQALQTFEFPVEQGVAGQSAGARSRPLNLSGFLEAIRHVDAAATISDSLTAIVRAARSQAPRAALYVANGSRLEQWEDGDEPSLTPSSYDVTASSDSIAVDAFRRTELVRNNGSACAIPLLLDGSAVAVLYGEPDAGAPPSQGWVDHLEAIARHGAARVGYLTALRTTQGQQWLAESTPGSPAALATSSHSEDMTTSARRYARLVVSEIKLYNESAVQEGRSRRDLLTRLEPEIDRARRLYEERVPASVPDRAAHFQQELVQTLAGGDASLLG